MDVNQQVMSRELQAENPTATRGDLEKELNPVSYVGDLGLRLGDFWGNRVESSCNAWFRGAHVYYVHAARTAILQACSLLKLHGGDEVLVPAYNCGSEVDALLEGGATVRFFRITRAGDIDLEDLGKRITRATKAVYIIHYFGFLQPLAAVADLCKRKGLYLIEDCALSTLTEVEGCRIGRVGDLAVYNFPKVLPVPDGGALVINNHDLLGRGWTLEPPGLRGVLVNAARLARQGVLRALPNAWAKRLDGLIRTASGEEIETGHGRREMPRSYYCDRSFSNRAISKFSAASIRHSNFSDVRARRRRHFSHLLDLLSKEPGVTPLYRVLPDGVCPLCFPILVGPARKVAYRLSSSSIPALPWWSGYNRRCLDWDAFPDACYLKDHVVTIPVHQQLSDAAIECIAKKVGYCLR